MARRAPAVSLALATSPIAIMAMPSVPRSPRTGLPLISKGESRRTCRCDDPAPALLRRGVAQFNRGEYWDCHETLEELWRGEPDAVRYLYQGILLAAVGLLHRQRGNRRGATSKLRAGLARLEPYSPACMGLDIAALRAALSHILERIDERDLEMPLINEVGRGQ